MNILDDSPLLVPLSLTTCPAVAVPFISQGLCVRTGHGLFGFFLTFVS